jgi:pSer/pThr/pTyr-binding forkhead associated (FHA) protein
MPLLKSGADRVALRTGTNTLGGRGVDAVPVAALAFQPAVAVITVQGEGPAIIQRSTASVVVRLDDQPLGVGPVELHHGAHIDFPGCRLTYETEAAGATSVQPATGVADRGPVTAHGERQRSSQSTISARLLNVKTGEPFPLPTSRKIVVGRDDKCDLVLPGEGVSRRHASISPVPGGYLLADESSNGTIVNGERIGRTHILEHGDLLLLHDEELRFEVEDQGKNADSASPSGSRAAAPTAVLDLSRLRGELTPKEARAAGRPSPTATLEIIRGPFTGAQFHIGRPVAAIGRGEHSDVRIRDESVSTTHATLLRKGDTWYVVDLRSVNGTFVDGYRVAGERVIATGATLRVGTVDLMFRSISGGDDEPLPRPPSGGVAGLLRWMKKTMVSIFNS